MINVDLERLVSDARGTLGVMTLDNKKFYTLERPWVDNIPYLSCIPKGSYTCRLIISGKFGKVYQVDNVPGRTAVLIHMGNFIRNTLGCILPGLEFENKEGKELAVYKSRIALAQFHEQLKGIPRFRINIHD